MKKKDIETQENFSAECGQVYEKTKKENDSSKIKRNNTFVLL